MFNPKECLDKPLPDLTKEEIMDLYRWAEEEKKEYQKFKMALEEELVRREGKK